MRSSDDQNHLGIFICLKIVSKPLQHSLLRLDMKSRTVSNSPSYSLNKSQQTQLLRWTGAMPTLFWALGMWNKQVIGVGEIVLFTIQFPSLKYRQESLDLHTLVVLVSCSNEVKSKTRKYQFIPSLLSTNNSIVEKSDMSDKRHSLEDSLEHLIGSMSFLRHKTWSSVA